MGLDDAANCNTGLGLSLGSCHVDNPADTSLQADDHDHQTKKMIKIALKFDNLLPSLTLGPSHETTSAYQSHSAAASKIHDESSTDLHLLQADQQASTNSPSGAVSSFSNSSSLIIKRDRSSDLGGEEVEVERVGEEYDQDQGSPRKKLRLTKEQSATLEDSFKEHATLNPKQKQDLARKLNLRPRQVEVWFQNRRARTKLKQTEADYELLKKCCETLKEENRRLQKELQELQLMKQTPAAPLFMQFPTATLSMCPSCETVCNATSSSTGDHHHHHNMNRGSSTMSPFLIGSKSSHFFNPFTHPSTAC